MRYFVPLLIVLVLLVSVTQCSSEQPTSLEPLQDPNWRQNSVPNIYHPLIGKERWNLYWRSTFWNRDTYLGLFFSATPKSLYSKPVWGTEFEGFALRAGNNFARLAISNSIEAIGAAAMGQDVRYIPCTCHGFLPRFGHALAMNFVTLNKDGHFVPAFARIGGVLGGQFIGDTWMPHGNSARKGPLQSVAIDLATGSLINVLQEFGIHKKHPE